MRGYILRLGDKVEFTQTQSFQRDRSPFRAVRTDHNHRHRMAAHNFLQRIDAVHAGHLKVERHHVGLQFIDLLKTKSPVHGGADDLNRFIGGQHLRDEFSHQRGIVDHEHAHRVLLHDWPPAAAPIATRKRSVCVNRRPLFASPACCGRMRAKCSTTAARLRISTTRPPPRMEAPETRSVEKVWSSNALITSSSSPSRVSTIKPYFRSPTVITRTNNLPDLWSCVSACGRPRRNSGNTWLRNCSTS